MSCTDKVAELEQLEAALPQFLSPEDKSQIAGFIEAINRNIYKSIKSMKDAGSKRLLWKFGERMRDNHEKLKLMREVLRPKYDVSMEHRVDLDRLVQGITTSVSEHIDDINDYLEEHQGEATVSQVDSHDSALETLFNEHLSTHRVDMKHKTPRAADDPSNALGRGTSPSYDELMIRKQPEKLATQQMKTAAGQQKTDAESRMNAELKTEDACHEADVQRLEARLHHLRLRNGEQQQPHQEAAAVNLPPPPRDAPNTQICRSYERDADEESIRSDASEATQVIKHLADCMEKISARSELPPAPVEMFDGSPAEYLFFMKNFQDRVGSRPFSDATKLSHLVEACTGHVKQEMMAFKGQAGGYQKALEDLQSNYGRPQQVVNAVITNLTRGRELVGSDTRALKDFARQIETSYSLLQELDMISEADTQANLKAIFARLPHRMRVRWAEKASDLEAKGRRPTFKTLVDFIVEQTRRSCHPVFEVNATKPTNDGQRDAARTNNNRQENRARNNYRNTNFNGRQSNWQQPGFNRQQSWSHNRRYDAAPLGYTYTNLAVDPVPTYSSGPAPRYPTSSAYAPPPVPPFLSYQINPTSSGQQQEHDRYSRTNSNLYQPPSNSDTCKFCNRAHKFNDCPLFAASDVATRKKFVVNNRLCFICLGEHTQNVCKQSQRECTVPGCKGKHHRLLHGAPSIPKQVSASVIQGLQSTDVLLRIVPVEVISKSGTSLSTYAMLDGGSTCSFLNAELANELGIRGTRDRLQLNTISDEKSHDVEIGECALAPINAPGEIIELKRINIMKDFKISYQPSRDSVDFAKWPHLKELPLKLPVDRPTIGLLIGEDVPLAHEIVENRYGANKSSEPYAARTNLGWYVAGPVPSATSCHVVAHIVKREHEPQRSAACCDSTSAIRDLEHVVQRLWNEEKHGFECSATRTLSVEDRLDLQRLKETVQHQANGHYCVGMLWKAPPMLPNNYVVARRCLDHVMKRMANRPIFRQKYREAVEGYINDGHAVKLSKTEAWKFSDRTWYLPHHGVENVNKPDKVRVVFNAASTYKGVSLNDQLRHGPDLNNSLVGTLLRFRKGPIAINGDIRQMFHQVHVPEEDSDALRFLWVEEGATSPTVFKMVKHIFGAKDSPTACVFTLQQCARDHAHLFDTITSKTVLDCFYMDDLLTAVATVDEAIGLSNQLIKMLSMGGFELEKFVSNNPEVLKALPQDTIAPACKEINLDSDFEDLPAQRALGLRWDVPNDTFRVKFTDVEKPHTRRGVLSFTASVIDPLGMIAPVVLVGRLIFQDACKLSLSWDQQLPDDLTKRWQCWRKGLPTLRELAIPRCYRGYEDPSLIVHLQLHHFCDASDVAYGVACYLRVELMNGRTMATLIYAKSRCKPMKHLSTPRLEAQAALTAVRCHKFVEHELKIMAHAVFFWTDSTIVLQYIRNTTKRFKAYVANRMEEIHEASAIEMWRHCPTKLNPSDAASRGLSAERIMNHPLWFEGPDFLRQPPPYWPTDPTSPVVSADDPELLKDVDVNVTVEKKVSLLHNFLNHYSSWEDLLRHTCTLMKFARYARRDFSFNRRHTTADYKKAREFIARVVQKQFFTKELERLTEDQFVPVSSNIATLAPILTNDLLRVGGRLQAATLPFDNQHPIILPKDHNVTSAVIRHAHATVAHCGPDYTLAKVRETFWIVGGKGTVKAVLRSCILCKRMYSRPMEQQMSPLPEARLAPYQPPFNITGADCFGPLMVKRGRSEVKRYGIIFCCFSTRAVHLELLPDMTTDSLINALRRFTSRRPRVRAIWCDNGTNLVGGSRELRRSILEWNNSVISECLLQDQIEWHFITPYAPHHAGVWERLVASTKRTLKAVLGTTSVKEDILHTALCEVENILNSRPITPASDDPRDLEALSPGHLLQQRTQSLPPGIFESADAYRRRWRQTQYLVNLWWTRWLKEYVPLLQTRSKWTRAKRNSAVGDLVLLIDDGLSRGQWPLGRVAKIYPSNDGLVRTVDVKTKTGVYKRPITKLCLLEGAPDEAAETKED